MRNYCSGKGSIIMINYDRERNYELLLSAFAII